MQHTEEPWQPPLIRTCSSPACVVLAVAAVLLALLGIRYPEAAILARIGIGALKFLVNDFRTGRATTIVVALAAYGTAMVFIARQKAPRPIAKEIA